MGTFNKAEFTTVRTRRVLNKRLEKLKPEIEQKTGQTNLSLGQVIDQLIDYYYKELQKIDYPDFKPGVNVSYKQEKQEQTKGKLTLGRIAKDYVPKTQARKANQSGLLTKSKANQAGLIVKF